MWMTTIDPCMETGFSRYANRFVCMDAVPILDLMRLL